MNLGKLKKQKFLEHHKEFGFSTRTELIDEALAIYEKLMKRRKRREWKKQALESYAKLNTSNIFETIESDDFE